MATKKPVKKPSQKKFQPATKYQGYDLDGDGTITDEELAMATAMKEEESALRKSRTQRNMALWTLVSMGLFTLAMFFIPKDRVTVLSDISNLFYLSGAGIVGAYMGMSAWMSRK
ncbi:MAG: hypothetical protein VW683_04050 [Betaproteobacteria bacterium]